MALKTAEEIANALILQYVECPRSFGSYAYHGYIMSIKLTDLGFRISVTSIETGGSVTSLCPLDGVVNTVESSINDIRKYLGG